MESLPCHICLDGAKKASHRNYLLCLQKILGLKIRIFKFIFLNDGFHLHVADANFQFLDAQARADMTGYILGKGILPETIGVYRNLVLV